MTDKKFEPYVPASESMPELTVKAVLLGVVMAIVLGAANAYLGMKVGLTVAATFPAAVVAMAALRVFRGNILEENMARTTASVGESLVAGAIFTIPAFVIAGAWPEFNLRDATLIMGIGGVLGVLFVIILRRALVVEADLPFSPRASLPRRSSRQARRDRLEPVWSSDPWASPRCGSSSRTTPASKSSRTPPTVSFTSAGQ